MERSHITPEITISPAPHAPKIALEKAFMPCTPTSVPITYCALAINPAQKVATAGPNACEENERRSKQGHWKRQKQKHSVVGVARVDLAEHK
jgi:hypothetical protein